MDSNTLSKLGIKSVLNVAGSYSAHFLSESSIEYLDLEVQDVPEQELPFDQALLFINKNVLSGRPVLVHCIEGKSRSGSVIIAYFMQGYGWDYNRALEYVRKQRIAIPNSGFVHQLEEL